MESKFQQESDFSLHKQVSCHLIFENISTDSRDYSRYHVAQHCFFPKHCITFHRKIWFILPITGNVANRLMWKSDFNEKIPRPELSGSPNRHLCTQNLFWKLYLQNQGFQHLVQHNHLPCCVCCGTWKSRRIASLDCHFWQGQRSLNIQFSPWVTRCTFELCSL